MNVTPSVGFPFLSLRKISDAYELQILAYTASRAFEPESDVVFEVAPFGQFSVLNVIVPVTETPTALTDNWFFHTVQITEPQFMYPAYLSVEFIGPLDDLTKKKSTIVYEDADEDVYDNPIN